ncbi:MAG: sulfotransferase [Maribacter sp.]|nr:sulfotransferase [Maribacter sp.]
MVHRKLVPIDQFASNKWIVCTYEELYTNPAREVARILDFLGLKWNKSVEKAIVQSARSTNEQSAISKGNNPLLKWQDDLQPTEISSICRMIQKFGIDIYGNEPMPDMKTFKV